MQIRKSVVLSRTTAWLLAFGIAGYPLISFIPVSLNVDSRVVTVPYRAAFLLLSGAVGWSVLSRRERRYRGVLWLPFLVFWLLYLARLIHDTTAPPPRLEWPIEEFYLFAIGTCFLPSLMFFGRMHEQTAKRALLATFILTAAGAVTTVMFNYHTLGTSFGRAGGNEYLNPISLGYLAVTLIVLCAYLLLQHPPAVEIPRIALWLGIPLGLLCLALSASRSPAVELVILLLLLCLHAYRRGQRLLVIALLALIAVASPLLVDWVAQIGSQLIDRLTYTVGHYEDEARLTLVSSAWSQFLDHPLLGSALVETTSGGYPHNVVVESFMATGILGGLAFTTLLLAGIRAAFRLILTTRIYAWLGLLFIQATIGAMFSGSLYTNLAFWYLLAVMFGVQSRKKASAVAPLEGDSFHSRSSTAWATSLP